MEPLEILSAFELFVWFTVSMLLLTYIVVFNKKKIEDFESSVLCFENKAIFVLINIRRERGEGEESFLVKCMSSMHRVLDSVPSTSVLKK